MDASALLSCVFCPNLCRHVCPVAVGSAREAATPTAMVSSVWSWRSGFGSAEAALASAQLCVSCGACTSFCKLHRPVPELLAQARAALGGASAPAALGTIEGEGAWVAVESDGRRWAEALGRHLRRPVARLRAEDGLGAALLDEPDRFAPWAQALREHLAGRSLVVADHEALAAARAAGLSVVHLLELIPALPVDRPQVRTCAGPRLPGPEAPLSLACCGAATGLRRAHPELAADVGASAAARVPPGSVCADARCGAWLRAHGAELIDPVSALLALGAAPVAPASPGPDPLG